MTFSLFLAWSTFGVTTIILVFMIWFMIELASGEYDLHNKLMAAQGKPVIAFAWNRFFIVLAIWAFSGVYLFG